MHSAPIVARVNGAKLLIVLGIVITVLGVLWLVAPQTFPKLFTWFGRLPGDIRIQNENSSVFIPITSMILVSVVLSVIMRFFK